MAIRRRTSRPCASAASSGEAPAVSLWQCCAVVGTRDGCFPSHYPSSDERGLGSSGWTGRGKPATVPHSTNQPRGRNENVDPDHLGGTGFIGRCLISLLAKRGDRLHGHQSADRGFLRIRQAGPRHALDDVMNALNSAKPSRVINLAYFLGSDPPRGRFAACRRPLDWRSVILGRRR